MVSWISAMRHPVGLVLALPPLAWMAYGAGGEPALIAFALVVPVLAPLLRLVWPGAAPGPQCDQVIAHLDAALRAPGQTGCLVLQFDEPEALCDRLGRSRQSQVLAASITRLRGALRPGDALFALEDGSLAVVLAPTDRLGLEAMVRIAGRLQMVVEQPLQLEGGVIHLSGSIGFCHSRQVEDTTGRAILDAAQVAADEARRHRPGGIRGYTAELAHARAERDALRADFAAAVAAGQLRAHFQPQLSTDSGAVSGMEALARWHHPQRGLLTPGDFLPVLEGTDHMASLAATMLDQALAALAAWDRAGLSVPSVSVNLSRAELGDPQLPEHLAWALDRHDLTPARLTVEVLESVVARDDDDIITRNLSRVAQMGCRVDMDDFGTGNASITSIRRFALRRLKIDRSFVRGVDTDREQQKLVTAILSLAEQLGLETVGEGVETPGEHAMLAQLGCAHVQGYAIARPMPVEDVPAWLGQHRERLALALRIGVRTR